MQHWIKTVYNDDGREAAEDWRWLTCVSDGPPGRRPRYAVGDELLISDSSQGTFPARARVTEEPDNLPEVVEREAGPGEGRRWPYLTYIEVLGAVDQSTAPTPRDLDLAMSQGGHRRLDEDTYRRAALHVPDGFAPSSVDTALSRSVPIERATDEPIKQRFEPSTTCCSAKIDEGPSRRRWRPG